MSSICGFDGPEASVALVGWTGTWFCPRHTCFSCGSLQKTVGSIRSLDLPLIYYFRNSPEDQHEEIEEDKPSSSSSGDRRSVSTSTRATATATTAAESAASLVRKNLRMCNACPFSTCSDCEAAILGSRQSFLAYKRATMVLSSLWMLVDAQTNDDIPV